LIQGCKKDGVNQVSLNDTDLKSAKAWVQFNLKRVDTNPFTTMAPNWDDIYTTTQDNQTIIEVGLNNPNRIFIGDSPNDANEPRLGLSKSNIRLVLIKNTDKNTIVAGCYMAIVNNAQLNKPESLHYKNVGNLNGKVYYFNTDGSFSNGSLYANGQIAKSTGKLNLLNQSLLNIKLQRADAKELNLSLKDKLVAVKSPCADGVEIPIWGQSCVGAEGYEVCSPYISGFAHLPGSCDGDYGDNEGYAGTHGGYGGGGTTSSKKVDVDPNARQCLKDIKAALEALGMKNSSISAGLIANVLNKLNLSTGSNFNGIITEGKLTSSHLAETVWIINPDPNQGLLTQIKFNSDHLNKMTDLAVAATMMHEYVHAYFDWNLRLMNEGKTGYDANFVASYNLLFDKSGMPLNDQLGTIQHEQMANSFATSIGEMVKKYADAEGIGYPADPDYFKKIGWIGLTGTQAAKHAPSGTPYTLAAERGQEGTSPLTQSLKCK